MYVDESTTKESLLRMIRRITPNTALREDLLQEALIHLWLTEARRPGQTKSWYLQSCKYHLLHYVASGRSVDSGKRRASQLQGVADFEMETEFPAQSEEDNSVFGWVSARDIISQLTPQLLPNERDVLGCFADGLGPREIGRKLNMSHTMVIKHRRKIAALFNRLEIPPSRRPPYFSPEEGKKVERTNGNGTRHGHLRNATVRVNGGKPASGAARVLRVDLNLNVDRVPSLPAEPTMRTDLSRIDSD